MDRAWAEWGLETKTMEQSGNTQSRETAVAEESKLLWTEKSSCVFVLTS